MALGVDRLGHATLLAPKPDLLKEGVARRLPAHPVKGCYAAGVPIALSTDDPGVFGIDLDHEYRALWKDVGFSPVDLIGVADQGIDAPFVDGGRRKELRERFERDVRSLLKALRSP